MASRGTLQKIKKLHAELKPPKGSVPFGMTEDGKPLYTLSRKRGHNAPRTDEHGDRLWRKHAVSGEPLVAINKFVPKTEHLTFFLESEGNGNVRLVNWAPPSKEDQLAAIRKLKMEQMQESFFAAAVDSGLEPEELLARIKGESVAEPELTDINAGAEAEPFVLDGKSDAELDELAVAAGLAEEEELAKEEVQEPTAEEPATELAKEYPFYVPVGRYQFSDGSVQRMKKTEAIEYEAVVKMNMEAAAEAKANAELTPEV